MTFWISSKVPSNVPHASLGPEGQSKYLFDKQDYLWYYFRAIFYLGRLQKNYHIQ